MRKFLYLMVLLIEVTQVKTNIFSPEKYGVWEMVVLNLVIYMVSAVVIAETILFFSGLVVKKYDEQKIKKYRRKHRRYYILKK